MRCSACDALRAETALEHRSEMVLMCPAGVAGLFRQPVGGLDDPWGLQGCGEKVDLAGRL